MEDPLLLLTEEEKSWWQGDRPHPVGILLWRLAAEREKVAQLQRMLGRATSGVKSLERDIYG